VKIPDYIALGVLIVLLVWAVADQFPRGKLQCRQGMRMPPNVNAGPTLLDHVVGGHASARGGKNNSSPLIRWDKIASRPGFVVTHSCQIFASPNFRFGRFAGLTRMLP
jgi:hypothetical protein